MSKDSGKDRDSKDSVTGRIVVSLPSWERHGMISMLEEVGTEWISLESAFEALIDSSKDELIICSPFADSKGLSPFLSNLKDAVMRGVRVLILVRSGSNASDKKRLFDLMELASSLNPPGVDPMVLVRSYHYSDKAGVLSGIHAKFIVSDREMSYVGSGEFRTNSYEKNLEVGLIVSQEYSLYLAKLFEYLFERSEELDFSGRIQ